MTIPTAVFQFCMRVDMAKLTFEAKTPEVFSRRNKIFKTAQFRACGTYREEEKYIEGFGG
jgi:hypothetical protein